MRRETADPAHDDADAQTLTDAHLARLVRVSLAQWAIPASVATEADGGLRIVLDGDGGDIRLGRAPHGIPFRWLLRLPSGRERPASSIAGLLRALRQAVDAEWRPGRARVVAVTAPELAPAAGATPL